ncbi:MAG: hypothetical protein SF162_13360 [bacterium]|nr:hypothetical protein [bacterium]
MVHNRKKPFEYAAFRREFCRLKALTRFERTVQAAERTTAARKRTQTDWWRQRALWRDETLPHSTTEAAAFERILDQCPRRAGDPLTRREQGEVDHLMRTALRAVLGEMRTLPPPPRRAKAGKVSPAPHSANDPVEPE